MDYELVQYYIEARKMRNDHVHGLFEDACNKIGQLIEKQIEQSPVKTILVMRFVLVLLPALALSVFS